MSTLLTSGALAGARFTRAVLFVDDSVVRARGPQAKASEPQQSSVRKSREFITDVRVLRGRGGAR
jgi:hypothetical protein